MSKLVIAAHQANFLPNLEFFNKMQQADVFVLITNLQFEKQEGWQRRNRIPGTNQDIWLTIPVLGSQNQKLKDVKINNQTNWNRKHKQTFRMYYGKSKYSGLLSEIEKIYNSKPERLVEINIQFIKLIKKALGIKTKLIVDEEVCGDKYGLLINICKKYGGTTYLSGNGARKYMTEEYFKKLKENNISHKFMENNQKINPYTAMHYLLNEGPKATIERLNIKRGGIPIINTK
ncbi:MAG: WbqC family protein [Nanoarchaeota archaeon]|nr:WbqC family protein [Nanoarchaeota archaeon]